MHNGLRLESHAPSYFHSCLVEFQCFPSHFVLLHVQHKLLQLPIKNLTIYFCLIKQCLALNGHLLLVLPQCLASTIVSPSLKDFELVLEPLSLFSSLLQLPLLQPHHYWLGPWVHKKH